MKQMWNNSGRRSPSTCAARIEPCNKWRHYERQIWQRHDHRYLEACDEVVVLMLDGWQQSIGVQAEISAARELGKPVTFLSAAGQAEQRGG
jgi:hypothetical protein